MEIINNRVFCLKNNSSVVGKITQRNKYYICVEIILPYKGWTNGLSISGPGRRTPNHFLTEHGDDVAQDLLKESYAKLQLLDKNIDWIVNVYYAHQRDIDMLDNIPSLESRKSIKWHLEEWFWSHTLFNSNKTGLIGSYPEHDQLIEIFRVYMMTGKKAFVCG